MKPKVKIPPKQRPIMFLMFGLALVFPWFFVGLRISMRDTMLMDRSRNGSCEMAQER
jgi:hypothetical protein